MVQKRGDFFDEQHRDTLLFENIQICWGFISVENYV